MKCCWPSCRKRGKWHVRNSWNGVVVFVVCDDHLHRLTKAFPPERCVIGSLESKESNDTTD